MMSFEQSPWQLESIATLKGKLSFDVSWMDKKTPKNMVL